MEIGSFIGLDLKNSGEYYPGETGIARLNSARAGIYHACRLLNCNQVYIPLYLCPTVKSFLVKKGMKIDYYNINEKLEPVNFKQNSGSAVIIVNYFGIFPMNKIKNLADRFENVIIDNSAAFYCNPIAGCYNVYSPRKFFGVPDGSYVIGSFAERYTENYKQDISSDTSLFLLKQIEHGTTAAYDERMKNEERIDNADILRMSNLTVTLLRGIDYNGIKSKRQENYFFANQLYKQMNLFDPDRLIETDCVPMVYPLVLEDSELDAQLRKKQIYVGRLWKHVLKEAGEDTFEARLSKYLIPVPVDQRYGREEIKYVFETISDLGGR